MNQACRGQEACIEFERLQMRQKYIEMLLVRVRVRNENQFLFVPVHLHSS